MSEFIFVLSASPTLFVVLAVILGLIVGSFLNVVIHRLPKMMEADFRYECECMDIPEESWPVRQKYNLIVPRSACPGCGNAIKAYDNIPVVSWLLLRGKCRNCGNRISIRYPIVELVTGVLTGVIAWHFGWGVQALGGFLFTWILVALFCIDADTMYLPDDLTYPLIWLGLLFNLRSSYTSIESAVVGAVVGYLILWSVYWIFKLLLKREGMGYGDFKLLAALGAWFGWMSIPFIILFSSLAGVIIGGGATLLAKRGWWGTKLPYGPYLVVAGYATMLWGNQALSYWMRM
ncbi:prepilin peptidase [Parachitinimonas caeni]|uniref:Prepilin leader peptidase/N-methyltransferase n=1 Tax=Parachitinimonas caeni TaxID=3031301 RepID=A0ABT7DXY7_9NEIS|nr:A24 family peptidase [Parachitinimonas caeni]MDK2124030.1 A24 family peptidase [Parachitinimonas caeni]